MAKNIKKLRGCNSMGDVCEKYFGTKAKIFSGIINGVICLMITGMEIQILSIIFENFLGIESRFGIYISAILLALYTSFGGMKAVTATDILQFICLVVAIFFLSNITINEAGGMSHIIENIPAITFSLVRADSLSYFISFFIIFFLLSALIFWPAKSISVPARLICDWNLNKFRIIRGPLKKFFATILLLSHTLQSCHTYTNQETHAKTPINQLIDTYTAELPPEIQENFKKEIAPIIKEKLSTIKDQETQRQIFQKLISQEIFIPHIIKNNPPEQWHKEITQAIIYKKIESLSAIFASEKILPKIFFLLERIDNTNYISLFLHTIAQKCTTNHIAKYLPQTLKIIVEYNCDKNICTKAIETILNTSPKAWQTETYKIIETHTFLSNYKLSEENIAAHIAQKSSHTYFVKNKEALMHSFEKIKKTFSFASKNFDSAKPICEWTERDITKFATHIRTKEIKVPQEDLISLVIRACELHNGYLPRDTQIFAIIAFLNKDKNTARLAQVNTGEGKSLIVAMLAAITVLQGNLVDVVTTSTELSIPEVQKQKNFFRLLNISVSDNSDHSKKINELFIEKREKNHNPEILGLAHENSQAELCQDDYTNLDPYKNDIVYGTADDFQGDILRTEFMKAWKGGRGARKFQTLIVDEVDSMLFDKRNHSIRLSNPTPAMNHLEQIMAFIWFFVNHLASGIVQDDGKYFYINEDFEINGLEITLFSKEKLENARILVPNLNDFFVKMTQDTINNNQSEFLKTPYHLKDYTLNQIPYWVKSAADAMLFYKKEQHYDVVDNKIVPIDHQNTGVLQSNMVWKNGLAQMLQIKEGLPLQPESICTNSLAGVNFFKRYSSNLYGLTGTLGNSVVQNFFQEIYNTDTVIIPPYKKCEILNNQNSQYQCKELASIVAKTEMNWYEQIITSALDQMNLNRAMLIICKYIEEVRTIERKLKSQSHHDFKITTYTGQEKFTKEIIHTKEIIIATNIAGRGTDISTSGAVEKTGGLHVCITFLPENLRVEMQNAGRTARQGKKGTTQLIIFDPEGSSIKKLRLARDIAESQAMKKAKKDIHNAIFKDRIFGKFCALEDEIFPSGDFFYKMECLNKLKAAWNENKNTVLSLETMESEYEKRIEAASIAAYDTHALEQISTIEKEEDKISLQNILEIFKESQVEKIIENTKKALTFEDFCREYIQNTLVKFCDIHRAIMPSDVIEAMLQNKNSINGGNMASDEKEWGIYERYALEERWGFWLSSNLPDDKEIEEEIVSQKFELFAQHIRIDAAYDQIIKNPTYFVKKAGSRPEKTTQQCYRRAINQDPRYSLQARYNYAMYLLRTGDHKAHYSTILEQLKEAKNLIEEQYKPEIVTINGYLASSTPKEKLFSHLEHQIKLLVLQENYINAAIEKVEFAKARSWKIKVEALDIGDALKKNDICENYDLAINEFHTNGFIKVHELEVIEPPKEEPKSKACEVATVIIVGVAQVAVGGALMLTGVGGFFGASLIGAGIGDIIYGIKEAFSDKPFSWKEFWVQKGVQVAIEAGTFALKWVWTAIKTKIETARNVSNAGSISATVAVGSAAVTPIAFKEVAMHIGKELVSRGGAEIISATLQTGYEKTFEQDINKKIYEEVETKLAYFFANNSLIQRALAADAKHSKNYWEQAILEDGYDILNSDKSHIQSIFSKITRGIAANTIPMASTFFLAADATQALNDLLTYTEKFLEKLEKTIESRHVKKLEQEENTPAKEDKNQDKSFYVKSDQAKFTIAFAGQIANKISSSIRSNIVNPVISKASSYTMEKSLKIAQDTLGSTKQLLRSKKTSNTFTLNPTPVPTQKKDLKDFIVQKNENWSTKLFTQAYDLELEIAHFKENIQSGVIFTPVITMEALENRTIRENRVKENYLAAQKHMRQKTLESDLLKDYKEKKLINNLATKPPRAEEEIIKDLFDNENKKSPQEIANRQKIQTLKNELQSIFARECQLQNSKDAFDAVLQKNLQSEKISLLDRLKRCEGWGEVVENKEKEPSKNNRTEKLDSLHEVLEKERKIEEELKALEKKFELEEELKLNKQRASIIDPLIQEWSAVKEEKEKLLENLKLSIVEKVELGLLKECKVEPGEITKIAETTISYIEKKYGEIDAACNIGVYTLIEKLTGNTDMYNTETKAPMLANRMHDHLEKSKDWEEVKGHQGLQALANDGYIVVAIWKNPVKNGHGHVTMIVPGKEQISDSWGCRVPCTFDTGANMRASSHKLSESFGKKKMSELRYFVYKHKKL